MEVDVETGMIKCTDVWAAHDCGKALNPLAVEGQIIGSCHMGLGQVLTEQMVYGKNRPSSECKLVRLQDSECT